MASAAPYTSAFVRPAPASAPAVPLSGITEQFEAVHIDTLSAAALLDAIDGEVSECVITERGQWLIFALRSHLAATNARIAAAILDLLQAD